MKNLLWLAFIVFTAMVSIKGCGEKNKSGCYCENAHTIERTLILSSSTTSGSLSIYGEFGDFVADAACHAEMTLTFYWQNPDLKQTEERPPVNYTFEAGLGYFPTNDYMNGDAASGYTWKAESNEAQDKDKPGGTNYAIIVNYDSSNHPGETVVCELKIRYLVYDEMAYSDGCE